MQSNFKLTDHVARSKAGAAETVEQQGKQSEAGQAWLQLQHINGYTGEPQLLQDPC